MEGTVVRKTRDRETGVVELVVDVDGSHKSFGVKGACKFTIPGVERPTLDNVKAGQKVTIAGKGEACDPITALTVKQG